MLGTHKDSNKHASISGCFLNSFPKSVLTPKLALVSLDLISHLPAFNYPTKHHLFKPFEEEKRDLMKQFHEATASLKKSHQTCIGNRSNTHAKSKVNTFVGSAALRWHEVGMCSGLPSRRRAEKRCVVMYSHPAASYCSLHSGLFD